MYDIEKRVFLVKMYSVVAVQRAFSTKYRNKDSPSRYFIMRLIKSFEKTGTVTNSSNKKIIRSEKRINPVKELISEFPTLSIRKMASAVGVSTKIVFNIRSDYLHLKSYKIRDAKRVEFAEWSLALGPNLKNSVICTDEAYLLSYPTRS